MVRLIPKVINGKRVYAEVAPEVCVHGHAELLPGWDQCPTCGEMVRLWRCRAVEDGQRCTEVDDEHVHGSRLGHDVR
jgi:predicted RNA-binding Zn-ribbon protein involved in translation (DUF1610 family)